MIDKFGKVWPRFCCDKQVVILARFWSKLVVKCFLLLFSFLTKPAFLDKLERNLWLELGTHALQDEIQIAFLERYKGMDSHGCIMDDSMDEYHCLESSMMPP